MHRFSMYDDFNFKNDAKANNFLIFSKANV